MEPVLLAAWTCLAHWGTVWAPVGVAGLPLFKHVDTPETDTTRETLAANLAAWLVEVAPAEVLAEPGPLAAVHGHGGLIHWFRGKVRVFYGDRFCTGQEPSPERAGDPWRLSLERLIQGVEGDPAGMLKRIEAGGFKPRRQNGRAAALQLVERL